jgi:hypothetical protein
MKTTSAALPVQFFLLLHLFSAIFYGSTCYINFIVYIGRQSYKQAWTEVLMVSIWTQTTEIEDGMIHQTHDLNAVPMTADTGSKLLWSRRVPNKIKIFWWLRHIDRLNIRANLHHKSRCANIVEDRNHLIFTCPSTTEICYRAGLTPQLQVLNDIYMEPPSQLFPALIGKDFGRSHDRTEDLGLMQHFEI